MIYGMLYFRKLIDIFILSIVPSVLSYIAMEYNMGYRTMLICNLIAALIFYVGNTMLIRRFVRDIKSKPKYYIIWLSTFAVYFIIGALLLWNNDMYPFTWIVYYHTRIFDTFTLNFSDAISTKYSFLISMLIYLLLILIARPIFAYFYEKEKMHAEEEELADSIVDILETQENMSPEEIHRLLFGAEEERDAPEVIEEIYEEDEDAVYTPRQLKRMEMEENFERRSVGSKGQPMRRSNQRLASQRIWKRLVNSFLNIGSYAFYQTLEEKIDEGIDAKYVIKTYFKRRMNLNIRVRRK